MTEQEKRAFVYAYQKVFEEEKSGRNRGGNPNNDVEADFISIMARIITVGLKLSDVQKMLNSVAGTKREVPFLSFIVSQMTFDEGVSWKERRSYLDRYMQLTGEAFPQDVFITKKFDIALLERFRDNPKRLSAYMEAYPVSVYIEQQQIKDLGIQVPSKSMADLVEAIRSSKETLSVPDILSVTEVELRDVLLERAAQNGATARSIIRNVEDIVAKVPDASKYVEQAIRSSGLDFGFLEYFYRETSPNSRNILSRILIQESKADVGGALVSLSQDLEFNYKLAAPFLSHVKPLVHQEYQKDPSISNAIVFVINALHERPREERFSIMRDFTAGELFSVLTESREHHYTSTFNGLFDIFLSRMRAERTSLSQILDNDKKSVEKLPVLIEAVATFNRGSDFLKIMSDQDKITLVDSILPDRTNSDNAHIPMNAIAVLSFLRVLPSNDSMFTMIESRLVTNYIHSSDNVEKIDIGLISNWYVNQEKRKPSEENAAFFQKFANDSKYNVPDVSTLPTRDLVDGRGRNFQMHLFYDDDDGKASYGSFKQALGKNGWVEKKIDEFVKFSKSQNGRTIEILVSPPERDGGEVSAIKKYVDDQGGKISVLVHRGHSYHAYKSLDHINGDNKLIFLGSCGGQQNVREILDVVPNAQILSTAGTGRMAINNQSFIEISQQIFGASQIDWRKMKENWLNRSRNDHALREDYLNYVVPYENLPLLLFRKETELLNETPVAVPLSQIRQDFGRSSEGGRASLVEAASVEPLNISQKAANDPRFSLSMNS